MPRLQTSDKSLYEPIEVEINGKVYTAVPFSPRLIRNVSKVLKDVQGGTIPQFESSLKQAAEVFGVPVEEFENVDVRVLTDAIEYVNEQVRAGRKVQPPVPAPDSEESAKSPEEVLKNE